MSIRWSLLGACSFLSIALIAQDSRWQQHVEYTMNVKLDVSSHKVSGTQKLVYFNNSPDTLSKIYYHLFFNAFQPGSMMDVRSRTISDPDRRVGDRIASLHEDEIGYQHVQSLKQDGKDVSMRVDQTILEVTLAKPILPHSKTTLDLTFDAQVPLQIRRSGRDNREGIAFTMTQWYPKLAEYDFQGWHADQYIAREFHGVWGNFDVTITTDPTYVIAGTGILQNPEKVGHGYEKSGQSVARPAGNLTWHFLAHDVIDFAWAADPDYTHDRVQVPGGPELHFFYQKNDKTVDAWKRVQDAGVKIFQYLNEHFGKYPFETYSVIQGGDGGMEYPMCTMILGEGQFRGVASTMAHEVAHSWYQMTLASNESLYPWMDEGFTEFASSEALAEIFPVENPHTSSYLAYFALVTSGLQEPASQHSDHYSTNRAYSVAAYSMGALFLNQLRYMMGDAAFYSGMKKYYNTWKMRHPEPNDFVRIMERASGLQLHWFLRYWIYTTKHIDYGIGSMIEQDGSTLVALQRLGDLPMPIDVLVKYTNGTSETYYITMNELLGGKPALPGSKRIDLDAWPWVYPTYNVKINHPAREIESIEINPMMELADINRKNNKLIPADVGKPFKDPTR